MFHAHIALTSIGYSRGSGQIQAYTYATLAQRSRLVTSSPKAHLRPINGGAFAAWHRSEMCPPSPLYASSFSFYHRGNCFSVYYGPPHFRGCWDPKEKVYFVIIQRVPYWFGEFRLAVQEHWDNVRATAVGATASLSDDHFPDGLYGHNIVSPPAPPIPTQSFPTFPCQTEASQSDSATTARYAVLPKDISMILSDFLHLNIPSDRARC